MLFLEFLNTKMFKKYWTIRVGRVGLEPTTHRILNESALFFSELTFQIEADH